MEDIIDIIVTETTNTIEITSQASDEIIDVNIIDNREDVTLNVTPSLVEININSLTGNFGVEWGEITGTLADQTDLQNVLDLKADLVDGKVPSSQLPSYVDDVIEVATYSALPTTGEVGKIYVVLDTNLIYRWSGSAYIEIKDSSAVWGAITGTLSSQTDLQSALDAKQDDLNGTGFVKASGTTITYDNSTYLTTSSAASTYVPYTGATANVDLGTHTLSSYDLVVNHVSGSGVAASITKGGNGEALTVVKSSGSGNAASITGGTTLLSELNVTGGITGTTVALTTSTLVDGLLVNNGSGRGIRVINAGAGYGIIINNETASSAIPFLIQKNGANKITFTDAGGATYSDRINTPTLYATGSSVESAITINQNSGYHALSITQSGVGNAIYATGAVTITGTTYVGGQLTLGSTITNLSGYTYTLPSATGTLALTSQLSSYLPLSGGTLTGALSGTSATFSTTIADYAMSISNVLDSSQGLLVRATDNDGDLFLLKLQSSNGAVSQTWVDRFTVAKNGAATFSSSVTAAGLTLLGATGAGTGPSLIWDRSGGYGSFYANYAYENTYYTGGSTLDFKAGNSVSLLRLVSNNAYTAGQIHLGGSVGIGTTALSATGANLQVEQSGTPNIVAIRRADNSNTGSSRVLFQAYNASGVLQNTGIVEAGLDNSSTLGYLALSAGTPSTPHMRITSSGSVGIGTTSPAAALDIQFGSSSSDNQFRVRKSDTLTTFLVRGDGAIFASGIYGFTTGSSANVVVFSDGSMQRSTSSIKYKKNVLNYTKGLAEVMQLRAVTYEGKGEIDSGKTFAGLIAEEVHDLGLTEFVQYAEDGTPDALSYQNMVSLLVKSVQELKAELDTLKYK